MPAKTWPPMKKPIEKFMKAAETPPNGPRIRMATQDSITWYAGDPIRGRKRLIDVPGGRLVIRSGDSERGGVGLAGIVMSVCMKKPLRQRMKVQIVSFCRFRAG